jgi:hypothetical protein
VQKAGQTIQPEDGVLYEDIGHRKGLCLYDARDTRRVHLAVMGDRVAGFCITRNSK